MDFISNKEKQIEQMLKTIGVLNIEELFQAIPKQLLVKRPDKDDGISELEGISYMKSLLKKNTFPLFDQYLGQGAYEHYIPAIVPFICSKSEFLTAYTPYQAEISQGLLQTIFEFQSAICAITGLDVSNASLYDGAHAVAEAVLMGLRLNKKRKKVLISESIHPHYREVIAQYLDSLEYPLQQVPIDDQGIIDDSSFEKFLDNDVAVFICQSPNYLGLMENARSLFEKAKSYGIYSVIVANPLSYGLYKSAKELGADIAVGDCQPFGLPLSYGGPYAGYIACRKAFVRQLPGRIVGETIDKDNKRGFVLTMQAREQHIRREKATSNICTNQALAALASLITMLWYGKKGIKKLALANYQKAAYLRSKLIEIGFIPLSDKPFFNEFAVKVPIDVYEFIKKMRQYKIEAGKDISDQFPQFKNTMMICVTETKSKETLDAYIDAAKKVIGN